MKSERTFAVARNLGCLACLLSLNALAQNCQLDPGFASSVNGPVMSVAAQADGKLLIGGLFTEVNGAPRPYLARLNVDGSLDTSFSPAQGPAQFVNRVVITPAGIFVSAGDGLRRFDTDGSLQWHYPMQVTTFAVDSENRVVFGGRFNRVENQFHRNLARLTAAGALDSGFAPEIGCCAGDGVDALLISGTQILVGGRFGGVNGTASGNFARLNSDGSVDASFAGQAEPLVLAIAQGPNGTIYRASEQLLARHLPNGAIDPSFATHAPAGFDERFLAVTEHGGGVVVGGNFTFDGSGARMHLARFDEAGALDASFSVTPNGAVRALAIQADGSLVIAGDFTEVDGQPRAGIARIEPAAPTTPAGPALTLARCAEGIVVSWPETGDEEVVLESRDINGGPWTAVGGTPVLEQGRLCLTNGVAGLGRIYRLVRQQ